jgi:hypothetical protein
MSESRLVFVLIGRFSGTVLTGKPGERDVRRSLSGWLWLNVWTGRCGTETRDELTPTVSRKIAVRSTVDKGDPLRPRKHPGVV